MRRLLLFFIFCSLAYSQVKFEPQVEQIIRSGIHKILQQEYSEADSVFAQIEKIYPNESMGIIFQASLKIIYAIDFKVDLDVNSFEYLLNKAEKKYKKRIEVTQNKELENYYQGVIDGMRAYAAYSNSDWLEAFKKGYDALNEFETVLETNKNNPDAKIAIGIYKFWRSRKTEFFSFLPFVRDEKKYGIELLKKGIEENSFFAFLGVNSLAWILIDQKKCNEAIENCNKFYANYPDFRFNLWALARAYEDIDIKNSIFYSKKLLNSIRNTKQNGYNEIVVLHILAQKEFQRNDYKKSLDYLSEIDSIKLMPEIRNKLKSRFERIEKLKNEIKELLKGEK